MARLKIKAGGAYTLPLFTPESSWRAPRLADLPSWPEKGRIAIDTETKDVNLKTLGPGVRRGAKIVGYSFAIEDGPKHYIPLRHEGGDNVEDINQGLRYLRDNVAQFHGTIVGANLGYDLDFLMEENVRFDNVEWFRDVLVADPLIDENQWGFSLDAVGQRRIGKGKNEKLLKQAADDYGFDPKAEMWRLPARYVGEYAEDDTALPLQVLRKQDRIIEEEQLQRVWDLESKVLPVLVKMRRRGVKIDFDHLGRVEKWCVRHELEALAQVKHETGYDIGMDNCWSADAVAPAFRKIGVSVPQIASGKHASIDKIFLTSQKGPVFKAVAALRRINKIRSTFVKSVRTHAVNGRIHCTFNQVKKQKDDGSGGSEGDETEGAGFGRLSCVDPNLQQQPARDPELGPMWRAVYVPDDGKIWCSNDYSQQEPRWAVHYAEITPQRNGTVGLPGSNLAGDRFRKDPATDFHQMMADIIGGGYKRKDAKEIYLGLSYGMGGAKLCRKLGMETKWVDSRRRGHIEVAGTEGQALIDKFDDEVPFVKMMAKRCEERANEKGYIVTAGGRHCHFEAKPEPEVGYEWCHKSFNRLIQGSSADQTKQALVDLDAMGAYLQLQVHDEINSSVENEAEAVAQSEIMRNAMPMTVPSKVDTELGSSWGASMGWKGWPE